MDRIKTRLSIINDALMEEAITYLDEQPYVCTDDECTQGKFIFDIEEVNTLIEQQARHSSLTPRLKAMLSEGNWRPYALVSETLADEIQTLSAKFPNFSDVVTGYQKAIKLASLTLNAPIYFPPLLLVGLPGVGKTRFLRELAKILSMSFFQADLATTSAGFVLSGSSTSWSEGKPGFVSDSLRQSKVANPLILLDEIDKASGDSRYDILGCLYTLLENDTAKSFKDEALTVAMDCQAINWVASANYPEQIPAPIRSRFNIQEVREPNQDDMPAIIHSVFDDLLEQNKWGKYFDPMLDLAVIDKLVAMSPRELKKLLYDACSSAAFRVERTVDCQISITVDDICIGKLEQPKRAIGFI